ncbi:hypothetical protein J4410_02830, partial [Candidatus Woesearchaeota archaeon]|nr:hypothetical protein [Candidatus Woesearchaeota archaeon]
MDYQEEMHQHMTIEASKIDPLLYYELENHVENSPLETNTSIVSGFFGRNYDQGDTIADGAAEEDYGDQPLQHFWQPDNPSNGEYSDGLDNENSSYNRALDFFRGEAVRNYLLGDYIQSFYWLGRVAHLLEDATQPGHMHLDKHPGFIPARWIWGESILEEYTGNRTLFLAQWDGNNYQNQHYRYENLISSPFNWNTVQPRQAPHKSFPDFFKLFWYTAQKTQYFASDDVERDFMYTELSGTQRNWDCSGSGYLNLWRDQFTSCGQFTTTAQLGAPGGVEQEANAVVPHGMKAVAGLYRLFWDTVHGYDWPTHEQNNRRNGVIKAVKSDLVSPGSIALHDAVISSGVPQDHYARPTIGDLDNDGYREILMTTFHLTRNEGYVFAIEEDATHQAYERWSVNIGGWVNGVASIANLDDDPQLEFIFGMDGGRIMRGDVNPSGTSAVIQEVYRVPARYSPYYGFSVRGSVGYVTIEDLDHNGVMEIIFADALVYDDEWEGALYVMNATGSIITQVALNDRSGGARGAIATANLDGDDNLEVIVPGYYQLEVYDYSTPGTLQLRWNAAIAKASSSAVVEDIDFDGLYEIIVNTNNFDCGGSHVCYLRTYYFDNTGFRVARTTHSFIPSAAPILMNADSDDHLEAVFLSYNSPYTGLGQVRAFDLQSESTLWTYNDGGQLRPDGITPSAADIDNDGRLNIIWPTNNNRKVYVLNPDGSVLYNYSFSGLIGSNIALGDLDNDDMLEMSLKREGSIIVTIMDNTNRVPYFNRTNASIFENTMVNGLGTLNIVTADPDGDSVTVRLSDPFNTSNQWVPDCHAEGPYEIIIEVSDGNLSAWNVAHLDVLDACDEEIEITDFNVTTTPGILNASFSVDVTNNLIIPIENVIIFLDFGDGTNTTCDLNATLQPGTS